MCLQSTQEANSGKHPKHSFFLQNRVQLERQGLAKVQAWRKKVRNVGCVSHYIVSLHEIGKAFSVDLTPLKSI